MISFRLGDVAAKCSTTRLFSLIIMFVGSISYAYGLSMIMGIMQKKREQDREFKELMGSVEEYATFRALPFDLRKMMREYFTFINARNEFINEKMILDQLPMSIRNLVLRHVNSSLITGVKLFNDIVEIEPDLFTDVIPAMQSRILRPDECAIMEGELSSSLYFISKGFVDVFKWVRYMSTLN
jgi:hypothetical protein